MSRNFFQTRFSEVQTLSGVPGIQQQIPMSLESSSVEQSEFREEPILRGSAVDLLPCLKSVVPLGAFLLALLSHIA